MGVLFFLLVFAPISMSSCYQIWHKDSVPFCGPGYRPSSETGDCVDAMGFPQTMDAPGTLEQASLKPEDWLGSFAGQCGEEDCLLSVDRTADEEVLVVLKRSSGEKLLLPLLRFSGNRAMGNVDSDHVRMQVDLQLRGLTVYGIWRLERTDPGEELGQESEIRFVGRRVGTTLGGIPGLLTFSLCLAP
jgi:hypothetical protein